MPVQMNCPKMKSRSLTACQASMPEPVSLP